MTEEVSKVDLRKVVIASGIGSVLEWYDFALFSAASALVFGNIFFPKLSPTAGIIASFGTFTAGFLFRPIGGILFGNLGDKFGRKTILMATILLMGIATTCIGLIPTFGSIGIWAPILLVIIRIIQGMGSGAEFGGASVFAVESVPKNRHGLYGSLSVVGVWVGIMLSTGIFALVSRMPKAEFLSWGWRIPFLLSIVLVGIGLYIRTNLMETPAFKQLAEERKIDRVPVWTMLRQSWKRALAVMAATGIAAGYGYIVQGFMLTYIAKFLGFSVALSSTLYAVSALLSAVTAPFFGWLSDLVGRRRMFLISAVVAAVLVFPMFWLVNTKVLSLVWLGYVVAFLGMNMSFAISPAFYSEAFSSNVRLSGFVFGREVSTAILGGTAPLVGVWLYNATGQNYWGIAIYMIIMAVLTFVGGFFLPETKNATIAVSAHSLEEEETSF